jgi:hypothetical protein
VRRHHSSAPEPAVTVPPFRHAHRARGGALHGLPLDEVGQDGIEAVVHLKGEGVVHGGVDQALVQLGGYLVGLAAQLGGHAPDLVPVKVDGITPELEHRKSGYVERKRRPYQGNVVRIA